MATAYTSLLGLALPVTGELSGTWGTTVNDAITSLLDTAVAGTTTISSDADVTLTTTTGASNTSRQAVLLWTAGGTVTRNITAPAQSKTYIVINKTSSTQSIVLRGVGPTTGVTIVAGESAVCAWNGLDFIKISNTSGAGTFTNLTVTGNTILGDASADTVTVNGTLTSNLIFTDNTYDIGASGATRPRTGYFGTSVFAPLVDATNLEVTNIKALDGTANISIANSTGIATFSKATIVETTDNTNAALRITQLGTGNALLVEDSANPDSTPFVIDSGGVLIRGATSSQTIFGSSVRNQFLGTGNEASNAIVGYANSATGGGNGLILGRSRGSTVGADVILQSGDLVNRISFVGSDGTALIESAYIESRVDGTPGTNDMPGRLVFSTTADGASSPTERMRINNAGNVGIGATSFTANLDIAKTITGGTSWYGIRQNSAIQSDVTTGVQYNRVVANTAASAFTVTNVTGYQYVQGTIGSTSAITNQYGFAVDASLTGATNNYGFYGNLASAANTYNLYMSGTANNYLAGNLSIGTTTSTSMLQVNGSSSISALKTPNIAEVDTISATAATGTINYDITTQSVLFYTSNASANWTVNFRGSSGTSLNTLMQTGESISATFLVTQGATAYYNSAVQIDGTSVTPKWQGGTAPTSGNASSVDCYTYVIQKTGSATYVVLASQTKFA